MLAIIQSLIALINTLLRYAATVVLATGGILATGAVVLLIVGVGIFGVVSGLGVAGFLKRRK